MKYLNITALIISLIGLAYFAYGAYAIYISSLNVADLSARISQDVTATGATWADWKRTFLRGGAYAMGLGIVTIVAGIGIAKIKTWGRTIWIFLTPMLLLTQFAEGQKSLTYFNDKGAYQLAFALLITIALTWLMLLLPSSRSEFARTSEQPAPQDRFKHCDP